MRVLAVVPARGGSKGLPGKNVLPLGGLPLIAHALRFAALCPEVARAIVSTDSKEIAQVAREHGGDVPFLRPAELARDDTGPWPVLKHALELVDPDGLEFDALLLLQPSNPFRLPDDLTAMARRLAESPEADGVVSVSDPGFDPVWVSVVERDGWMEHLVPEGVAYERRQDVPRSLRINGALYLWRTAFVRREARSWLAGRHRLYEMPRTRVVDIDEAFDLELAEAMLGAGLVSLPWLRVPAGG